MSADYDPLVLQLEINKMVSVLRGSPTAIAEIAVKTHWALERALADHKKEKLILLKRAEAAEARAERLKTALMLILDCADYTSGACGLTEMIGGVLPRQIIDRARDALKGGEG